MRCLVVLRRGLVAVAPQNPSVFQLPFQPHLGHLRFPTLENYVFSLPSCLGELNLIRHGKTSLPAPFLKS